MEQVREHTSAGKPDRLTVTRLMVVVSIAAIGLAVFVPPLKQGNIEDYVKFLGAMSVLLPAWFVFDLWRGAHCESEWDSRRRVALIVLLLWMAAVFVALTYWIIMLVRDLAQMSG